MLYSCKNKRFSFLLVSYRYRQENEQNTIYPCYLNKDKSLTRYQALHRKQAQQKLHNTHAVSPLFPLKFTEQNKVKVAEEV